MQQLNYAACARTAAAAILSFRLFFLLKAEASQGVAHLKIEKQHVDKRATTTATTDALVYSC